jgi:hypothetical protein
VQECVRERRGKEPVSESACERWKPLGRSGLAATVESAYRGPDERDAIIPSQGLDQTI